MSNFIRSLLYNHKVRSCHGENLAQKICEAFHWYYLLSEKELIMTLKELIYVQ